MIEVSKVLTFGAEKYGPKNWRELEDLQNRYSSAALRHVFSHLDGSELDEDSGLSHLAHAICCLLFKLEIELENAENEKSQEEGSRESDVGEFAKGYQLAPAHFYGSETYNKETGLRDVEYNIQYKSPGYDTDGISRQTGIRAEKKKPKPWKSSEYE